MATGTQVGGGAKGRGGNDQRAALARGSGVAAVRTSLRKVAKVHCPAAVASAGLPTVTSKAYRAAGSPAAPAVITI